VAKFEIEVMIEADGRVTLRPKGAQGPGCLEMTRGLEEALGEVESRELTADYYRQASQGDAWVRGGTGEA
jgi:hypothetical protein